MEKKRGKKLKKIFVRRFFFQKAQYFVILLIKIRKVQKKPPFSDLADSAKPKFSRHGEAKKSHFGGIPPLLATLFLSFNLQGRLSFLAVLESRGASAAAAPSGVLTASFVAFLSLTY